MNTWHSGRESGLLDDIIAGRKTVEGRLCKGKFAQYRVGDHIFLRRDYRDDAGILQDGPADQARVEIVAIRHYDTFFEMVSAEGWRRVIPSALGAHGAADEYNKYYSAQDQSHYGVLAVEIKVI